MRILPSVSALCLVISLGGCVVYPAQRVAPYAPVAAAPAPVYVPPPIVEEVSPYGDYVYYQGRPAVIIGGVPNFLVYEPNFGWGWWGYGHRWFAAPRAWGPRLEHERRHIH